MKSKDWQSIALPIILMITGIVLLGGNFLGFLSLVRIENLWPAAVIAIGVIELLPWLEHRSSGTDDRFLSSVNAEAWQTTNNDGLPHSRSSDVRQVR